MKHKIPNHDYYPFTTKFLIDLFNDGELPNIKKIDIEPDCGLVGRIVNIKGDVHLYKKGNLGLNSLGASEIAQDKLHTKYFLSNLGYNTPEGHAIILPKYYTFLLEKNPDRLKNALCVNNVEEYLESTLGYPCYIKPNFGSQGRGIFRCENVSELKDAIMEFIVNNEDMCLIEKAVNMPDYRVVVLKNEVISCYLRKNLQVIGDGESNIEELLELKQKEYIKQGRDTVIDTKDNRLVQSLKRKDMTYKSILRENEKIILLDVSNLSLGGESEDFTEHIDPYWKDLCIRITKDMGLKFCGVDIACNNITDSKSDYSILEINAAPGLDNYAVSGDAQQLIVRNLYKKIFNSID